MSDHDAESVPRRSLPAMVVAGLALVAGLVLAATHPLHAGVATALFATAAAAFALFPYAWPGMLPAVLPLLALAPYSGATAGEEVDLVVLAVVAGGYAAPVWGLASGERRHRTRSAVAAFLVFAFGTTWVVGVARGLIDAGSAPGGWLDGYHDPGNTLRVAKAALWAALLLPLWLAGSRRLREFAGIRFAQGTALGLVMAALVVVGERIAFTGLANFSTDYRVTGPFWEMHTGGAALDGYLALALPWIAWLALRAHRPWQWFLAMVAAGLAYYVALVTFSRAVYLALPVGLAVFAIVGARQVALPRGALLRAGLGAGVAAVCAAVAAWYTFRHGGYRTLAAVLGVAAVMLTLAPAARTATVRTGVGGLCAGALGAAALSFVALAVPKGPYAAFGLVFAACAAVAYAAHRPVPGARIALLAWTAIGGIALAAALVGWHWGGDAALRDTVAVLFGLLLMVAAHAAGSRALLPDPPSYRAGLLIVAVGVAGLVAVTSGGDYMSGRVSGARADFDARLRHWTDALAMLESPADRAWGHGFGRFPARYLFHVPDGPHPGTHRVADEADSRRLVLAGPRHSASFGEMLRIGQWIRIDPGRYIATIAVRAERPATLHVELCSRHLLYNGECAIGKIAVEPSGGAWQRTRIHLDASAFPARELAMRSSFFALAVESERTRVEIAEATLTGPGATQRLANIDFRDGIAHWFVVSERHHLPWHAKNLAVNVLFEQGAVGLAAFAALVATALWRVALGRARRHPLAPALAASLGGFLVVGIFDSLLDAPRIGLMFWLMLLVALTLPAAAPVPTRPTSTRGDGAATVPA